MGLFTRNNNVYVSESSISNETIDTPSIYDGKVDYTIEGAYAVIAQNEANYTTIMKSIAIDELAAFEQGTELSSITEATGGIFSRLIAFLKNIWEKIKGIFRKFIAMIDSMTKSNSDFVKKYRSYVLKPGVTNNFSYQGYNFTIPNVINSNKLDSTTDINTAKEAVSSEASDAINNVNKVISTTGYSTDTGLLKNASDAQNTFSTTKNDDNFNAAVKAFDKIDEEYDKIEEALAKHYYNVFSGGKTDASPSNASELAEELNQVYRDGETSKITLEDSDIKPIDLISKISAHDKTRKDVNKVFTDLQKSFDRLISALEKRSSNILRNTPAKNTSTGKVDTDQSRINELENKSVLYATKILTTAKNFLTVACNTWLSALDAETKQAKAICVQLVNRGTNVKQESAYYEESYSGSYLGDIKLI
jgi:hypothetical protein